MSYSIGPFTATPARVVQELESFSATATGGTKEEFDAALPSFKALISLNAGPGTPMIKFAASGHAYANADSPTGQYSQCQVTLERLYVLD